MVTKLMAFETTYFSPACLHADILKSFADLHETKFNTAIGIVTAPFARWRKKL